MIAWFIFAALLLAFYWGVASAPPEITQAVLAFFWVCLALIAVASPIAVLLR
jgi:hypothetical protein